MSKMKASFKKGKFGRRLAVSILTLVLLFTVVSGTSAFAWDWGDWGFGSSASFKITVKGSSQSTPNRGQISASLSDVINFQSEGIFVGTNEMQKVQSIEVYSDTIKRDGSTPLVLAAEPGSKWQAATPDSNVAPKGNQSFQYRSREAITKGTFDSLMSQLSVYFNQESGNTHGEGMLTIVAYSSQKPTAGNLIKKPYTSYSCEFKFYSYAQGEVEKESAVMDYKSDYAQSYDSKYEDDVPDGQVTTGVLVNSPDATGGKAEFDLYLTEKGRGKTIDVGYQVKKSTEPWTSTDESQAPQYVKHIDDLKNWDENDPIHISVEGLADGETYDIRGIVCTDGREDAPKQTGELSFSYQKPKINSFNIGGITSVYQGGKGLMNLSMLTTFNDTNAVGVGEYQGINGRTYNGPALQADIYFTTNRDFEVTGTDENGKEIYGEDHSIWYMISDYSDIKEMADEEGEIATTYTKDWKNFKIPATLEDIGVEGNTAPINSDRCAFKLVITDLYTGYTAVTYSDPFIIDSAPPSRPEVVAESGGTEIDLSLESEAVVGGTSENGSAQVSINIGDSDDQGGFGIKQYSYSMYYLPTDKVPASLTTTGDVLRLLQTYTPTAPGASDYKEWTALETKLDDAGNPVENMTELVVAKDGYYRVIARAEDKAGFISEEVEGYFRVDLTAPDSPVARLAKREDSTFKAYDNRTYTNSEVWAFAYSKPQTGKALKSFKFSTNGGLTWTDISTVAADKKIVKFDNVTETIPTYKDAGCTQEEGFVYQVGINLTGLGYSDYISLLIKAVDSLGNESMVSNEVHMRTASEVETVATLSHDPIEVAMALGNTNLEPERNIVPLKIRAAKMINEKYYGTSGSTTIGATNFNPYLYTQSHTCTYATDSGTGSCTQGASCPYNRVETAGYSIYKPEWINISGLSSGTGAMKITDWNVYDHDTRTGTNVALNDNGYVHAYTDAHARNNGDNGESQPSSSGGSACMQRRRHIIDMSSRKDWSEILFTGVSENPDSDWLFYHFTQPTKKSILFTMNTAACNFHTYVQSGFWFNTTIRKNKAGTYVVSGYRLMIRQGAGSWGLTDVTGSTQNCGLEIQKFTDMPVTSLHCGGGGNIGSTVATANLTGTGAAIQNFMIDLTGSDVTVYQIEGTLSSSNFTQQYFRGHGRKVPGLTNIPISRPTVDGYTIGDTTNASNPYRDSDCYGFGPAIGYSSHSCDRETRVTFSNVTLYCNVAKTLSEVVTEPSWGEGKARFILNVTNDAQQDFHDPALTSQIQWRLNNDKARYIGWGISQERTTVINFLKRMAGQNATADEIAKYGMYENVSSIGANQGTAQEFTDIATYITQQYYAELGFDASSGAPPIKDQVSPGGGIEKGMSYTLDNVSNLHFTVYPPERAESSANPDFPAGRWYMVHDPKGMGDEVDIRSGKLSDALNTDITLPGRYTYYFAPSEEDIKNNTLDPDNAVFDFVINQKPQAQFAANIVDQGGTKYLQIADVAYDPDCPEGPYIDTDGTKLSGIVKTEWKYQFLMKSGSSLVIPKESGWSTTSPDGMTLKSLTGYDTLPTNSVLTIYQRVTDTATRRVAVKDSNGKVTGYKYVATNGAVSDVCQANATEGVSITYAPQSAMILAPTTMYDTASDPNSPHRTVTIERVSTHPQGNYFTPSWAINLTEMGVDGTDKDTGYTQLTKSGNNYTYKGEVALRCVQAPTPTGNIGNGTTGSEGGKWEVSYDFIKKYGGIDKHIKFQLTEKTWGISAATAAAGKTDKDFIPDQSARSILLAKDVNPPSSQVVTTGTQVPGSDELIDYAASTYLDVTNDDRFVVVSVGGSKDNEGVLKGYGYYFYDVKNGVETAWYRMESDGRLTKVSSAKAATQTLPAIGGRVKIGKSAMRKLPDTPTDSLNIAVFAYDNQTGMSTETTANQTTKTRITDIKLSVSQPMPPEISVTNMMNQNVAYISNENGYKTAIEAGKTDEQTSALEFYSATNVTVQFTPRKAKFIMDSNGDLQLNAGGQEYYQDYYGKADMTGTADIRYTVKYKARKTDKEWWTDDQLLANGMDKMPVDATMSAAQALTYTHDGVYEVTGAVVNGSGNVSETRTVRFTIDKTAPTGLEVSFTNMADGSPYFSGIWTKSVSIEAHGATDTNADTAEYQYSIDGGKTWIKLGDLTQTSASIEFDKSGKYNVKVRAVDKAGNESIYEQNMLVCIDNTPPETNGPTLTATSVMTDVLNEYVISLDYDTKAGAVHSEQNGVVNQLDREVAVPAGGSVIFTFLPEDGHILGSVTYNGEDMTGRLQANEETGIEYLEITNVKKDTVLSVTFPETQLEKASYRTMTRSLAAVQYAVARTASVNEPETDIALTAEAGDEGETGESELELMYNVSVYELDSFGSATVTPNQVIPGEKALITMSPLPFYRVASLQVNKEIIDVSTLTKVPGSNQRTYEITVNGDTNIFVGFEAIETRPLRLDSSDCGTTTIRDEEEQIRNNGDGTYEVPVGAVLNIQMDAEEGYGSESLKIDGTQPEDFQSGASLYQYTVPAFTGEGEDPGIAVEIKYNVLSKAKRKFKVYVGESTEDGQTHGTINACGDEVFIPIGGARTFTITPDLGYKLAHLYLTTTMDGESTTTEVMGTEGFYQMPGELRQYKYTLTDSGSSGELQAIFERQTYAATNSVSRGGDIVFKKANDENLYAPAIPEGTDVLIKVRPKDGYRVKSLSITEIENGQPVNQYSVGAVTSYVLPSIHSNIRVDAVFVEREVDHIETMHVINAVANNVKDADDALAEAPYRFCIADAQEGAANRHASKWSAWSASNTITYTGSYTAEDGTEIVLEPNKQYFVYLQARDRVGNVSKAMVSTVYSYANMPGTLGAEALDEEGNYASKSVALQVNTSGNPEDTEYLVYYSTSSSMANMQIANSDEPGGGWSTLQPDGTFLIKGLTPGRWYHLQVVARNKDGYSTRLNSDDITSILLSPAAPPEDSFWFEEQESPVAPISLGWNAPSGDILGIHLYLDGVYIGQRKLGTNEFTHVRSDFLGDSVGKYSYAYENSAGVGSSRVAISKEYYDVITSTAAEDADKRVKMDTLTNEYEYMFSETMTYPTFHAGSRQIYASAQGSETSGQIEVEMRFDTTYNARYQKYFLVLKAYEKEIGEDGEPVLDEEGDPIYHEVTIDQWDPEFKYHDRGSTKQKAVETKVSQKLGTTAARAIWTNLSTLYEYNIYAEEIRSTGKASSDNLSGSTQGLEFALGKVYIVNRDGYRYEYTSDNTEPKLDTYSSAWKGDELAAYAVNGWDTPVNNGYITFQKSPSIELAAEADRYYDNDGEKIRTDESGKPYILVDNSMDNKNFHVNVAAWDPDGYREESGTIPAVGGSIAKIPGNAPKLTGKMPARQEDAVKRENLYPITFDASGLSTGVYSSMEMWASDSDTRTERTTDDLKLIVNRNLAECKVVGDTHILLENGEYYLKDDLVKTVATAASDGSASTDLTKVALLVMPEEYQAAFGTSNYDELYRILVTEGHADPVAKAKELLGDDAGNSKYVTGGKLTEAGMNLAVARVAPPVVKYVAITEEQYNARIATAPDKLMKEENKETRYWAELDYALDEGICSWLVKDEKDSTQVIPTVDLKPTDAENTYFVKVVAKFGGNESVQTVSFVIRPAPYTKIRSQKAFRWIDTAQKEYEHYQVEDYTIDAIIEKYKHCYDPNDIIFEDPLPDSDKAYTTRVENGKTKYYVYKLYDYEGSVDNSEIAGTIEVNLGVYEQFDEVGVLLVTEPPSDFHPNFVNDESEFPEGYVIAYSESTNRNIPIRKSGDQRFTASQLVPGQTYYLWSFYKRPDDVRRYSEGHVVLTTVGDFELARYGFARSNYSYEEKQYDSEGTLLPFDINKVGSKKASATVRVTPRYYQSDEFGNLILGEDGEPIELTGDALEAAKETFGFDSGKEYETYTFGLTESRKSIRLRLRNTDKTQGHMVVRLEMDIESSDAGYCYVIEGSGYSDIFIQDDESPVTSYVLGVVNEDDNGKPFLKEVSTNGKLLHYEYQLSGLQVGYSQLSHVIFPYENIGTGDLENITVKTYKLNADGSQSDEESREIIAEQPSHTNLKVQLPEQGTVEIRPAANLADGVYEAWVVLTADHVKEPVRIKVRQVVGQSTLRGCIGIRPLENGELSHIDRRSRTGVAKVLLYDAETAKVDNNGDFVSEPDYVTETSEYGGAFEIPNILNAGKYSQGKYYIVVERDGYITYNARKLRPNRNVYSLDLGSESHTYTFDLRLIGGDINGDQVVDNSDMEILVSHYNMSVNLPGFTDQEREIVRLCDFNEDGTVNALDRGFLIGNMNSKARDYPTDVKKYYPIPADDQ